MSREEAIELLNRLIDDHIDTFGYAETINYLLDLGCTPDQLIDDLLFDENDIKEITDKN